MNKKTREVLNTVAVVLIVFLTGLISVTLLHWMGYDIGTSLTCGVIAMVFVIIMTYLEYITRRLG